MSARTTIADREEEEEEEEEEVEEKEALGGAIIRNEAKPTPGAFRY